MSDFVKEQCCSDYFVLEYLIGEVTDTGKLMSALGKTHFLSQKESDELYLKCSSENVREVTNEKEYFRYLREKSLLKDMGETWADPEEDELITIKGEAIATLVETQKDLVREGTPATIKKAMTQAAASGDVCLMKLVGMLMAEGIFFSRNKEAGVRLISKAADWNDVGALMMKLYYSPEGKEKSEDLNKLEYLLDSLDLKGEIKKPGTCVPEGTYRTSKEAALLERQFAEGKLERGKYSEEHARVIFSKALSFNDKRQALASDKGNGMDFSELPLGLKDRKSEIREDVFGDVPVTRENERRDLLQAIRNADLRMKKVYRPVLLTSRSDFMLGLYAEALEKGFEKMNVVKIEVSELNAADLEPSQNNVFVRFCDENCDNAYFLYFRGETSREIVGEIKEFLRTESRASVRLNAPSVTLDLSPILPVAIADARHAALLSDACDAIVIEDAKKEEMPALIGAVLKRKADEYGVASVSLDDELYKKLSSGKIDDAVAAIDLGVRKNRVVGKDIVLGVKDVAGNKMKSERRLGFGGTYED